jgi:hypothetical protein
MNKVMGLNRGSNGYRVMREVVTDDVPGTLRRDDVLRRCERVFIAGPNHDSGETVKLANASNAP